MDILRQKRSIALNHIPPVPIPHRLEYPLGSRRHFVITIRGWRPGGDLLNIARIPHTHEPTSTHATDPADSRSTLIPADTSRPSWCQGHFPGFPWSDSPSLAHKSLLHCDWSPNPMGLLFASFSCLLYPALLLKPCDAPLPCDIPWSRRCPLPPVPYSLRVFIPHQAASNTLARVQKTLLFLCPLFRLGRFRSTDISLWCLFVVFFLPPPCMHGQQNSSTASAAHLLSLFLMPPRPRGAVPAPSPSHAGRTPLCPSAAPLLTPPCPARRHAPLALPAP